MVTNLMINTRYPKIKFLKLLEERRAVDLSPPVKMFRVKHTCNAVGSQCSVNTPVRPVLLEHCLNPGCTNPNNF